MRAISLIGKVYLWSVFCSIEVIWRIKKHVPWACTVLLQGWSTSTRGELYSRPYTQIEAGISSSHRGVLQTWVWQRRSLMRHKVLSSLQHHHLLVGKSRAYERRDLHVSGSLSLSLSLSLALRLSVVICSRRSPPVSWHEPFPRFDMARTVMVEHQAPPMRLRIGQRKGHSRYLHIDSEMHLNF